MEFMCGDEEQIKYQYWEKWPTFTCFSINLAMSFQIQEYRSSFKGNYYF